MRRIVVSLAILGFAALGVSTGTTLAVGSPGAHHTAVVAQASTGKPPVAQPVQPVQPVTAPVSLPGGIKPWWTILGLVAVAAFAFGMKRLPDQVLQSAGTSCRLKE